MSRRLRFPALLFCFFLSGFTALLYEVLWVRIFVLKMGSTALGVSTVVAAFMAGLGLGAWLCGRSAGRLARPLRAYALLELGIALSALAIPWLLELLEPLYRIVWQRFQPQFLTFSLLQFYFAFLLLLLPTSLMGATLPVLSEAAVGRRGEAGGKVGALYGFNTLGAVAGTVAAGFLLIPTLGMRLTLLGAAGVNVLLALLAWGLGRVLDQGRAREGAEEAPLPEAPSVIGTGAARVVLAVVFLSGLTAMVYEVAWTRSLSLVIGSSVYSFTIVLACFLAGIALGSALLSLWADRLAPKSLWWIAGAQFFVGATAYVTASLINELPYFYARAYKHLGGDPASLNLLGFALASLVILPATLGMGATFPLSLAHLERAGAGVGRLVGRVYALNTLGAILGAFLGGFVFLVFLGIRNSLVAAMVLNLMAAAGAALRAGPWRRAGPLLAGSVSVAVLIVLAPPGWNPLRMSSGVYKYANVLEEDFTAEDFREFTEGEYELLFYQEGVNVTVAVVRRGEHMLLINNGKIDASNRLDLPTQLLSGHLPLLLHAGPEQVCVIGAGSGVTAGSVLRHDVRSLVLLEIESAVLRASHFFDAVNHQPLSDSRTELIVADGRNYLKMTDRRFDVIISEPSNPWISGVSNLFTREFFEIGRARLRSGGIFAQWVQLYGMPPRDLRVMLATLQSVFPHVQVFSTIEETDLIVLGSERPLLLDAGRIARRMAPGAVAADLARVGAGRVEDVLSYFKIGSAELQVLTRGSQLNTDDNAYIEFSAPLHLAHETRRANRRMLDEATGGPVPYLTGLEEGRELEDFLAALASRYRERSKPKEAALVRENLRQMRDASSSNP